jgi:cytochrome P450
VPTAKNRAFNAAVKVIDAAVWSSIARRRSGGPPTERADMLSLLVGAQDPETGAGMSDAQLRDEVVTMLLAGHETTAGALMWTIWLLAKHPDVRAAVEREIDASIGDATPHAEQALALPLLGRVLKESLRLYPIVWNVARHVEEDDVVLGCRVRAGTVLCLTPYISHRNPRFWEDPERFDPDRFLPAAESARPKGAYIPFLAGPRACIGAGFSTMEMLLVLAVVLRRFRLDIAEGCSTVPEFRFTIRPSGPLLMTLARREGER